MPTACDPNDWFHFRMADASIRQEMAELRNFFRRPSIEILTNAMIAASALFIEFQLHRDTAMVRML
jgi:hypothetical protein